MHTDDTIDSIQEQSGKSLSSASIQFLLTSAKWAKFLAIVGFVIIGLIILASILFASFLAQSNPGLPQAAITIIYIIVGGIWLPPCIFLYRFSNEINDGLNLTDNDSIEAGFSALKSHFKYIGVLTIVILGLYALLFLIGLIGGLM